MTRFIYMLQRGIVHEMSNKLTAILSLFFQDAWPWIGWLNVYDKASPKTCGGYLVCRRYFVTAASCVTMVTDDGNVTTVDKTKVRCLFCATYIVDSVYVFVHFLCVDNNSRCLFFHCFQTIYIYITIISYQVNGPNI